MNNERKTYSVDEYFEALDKHIDEECKFAFEDEGINDELISITKENLKNIAFDVSHYIKDNFDSAEMCENVLHNILGAMYSLTAGMPISTLTGRDSEWVDVTVEEDVNKIIKIDFRGKSFNIKIESIQQNKREPNIFRFNNDNRYAHNLRAILFVDSKNQNNVYTTENSFRFIQFPYRPTSSIYIPSIFDENGKFKEEIPIMNSNGEYDTSANIIAFKNPDGPGKILLPKIPLFMFDEYDIDISEELTGYKKAEE